MPHEDAQPPISPPPLLPPVEERYNLEPLRNMQSSDIALQSRFPENQCTAEPWTPVPHEAFNASLPDETSGELAETIANALDSPVNNLVPEPPTPQDEEEQEEENKWTFGGPEANVNLRDGGVSSNVVGSGGATEYLESGYTRRRPWETRAENDNDFAGRFETNNELFSAQREFFNYSGAIEEGSFGSENDLITGSGSVLSGSTSSDMEFSLGSDGVKAEAQARAEGAFLDGELNAGNEDGLVNAGVEGSAVSGEAEASVALEVSPEEASLSGKLGAEVNLLEAELNGEICVTPMRVANPLIRAWNYIPYTNTEELGENWDIGVCVNGAVGGQVGAQAGIEGSGYIRPDRAGVDAEAKLGLGLGANVRAGASVIGLDHISGEDWRGALGGLAPEGIQP